MSEILISPTWNPKKSSAFWLMFSDVTFHIEMFATNMTFTTLYLWIFTWKIHFKQCNVKSVENMLRRNENNGTPTKKAPDFFGSCLEISIFHLLQNPILKLMSSFPNNHYWAYTFLIPWALPSTNGHLPKPFFLFKK